MAGIFETQRNVQGGNPGFTSAKDKLVTDRANSGFIKNPNGRKPIFGGRRKSGGKYIMYKPSTVDWEVAISVEEKRNKTIYTYEDFSSQDYNEVVNYIEQEYSKFGS